MMTNCWKTVSLDRLKDITASRQRVRSSVLPGLHDSSEECCSASRSPSGYGLGRWFWQILHFFNAGTLPSAPASRSTFLYTAALCFGATILPRSKSAKKLAVSSDQNESIPILPKLGKTKQTLEVRVAAAPWRSGELQRGATGMCHFPVQWRPTTTLQGSRDGEDLEF